MKARCLVMLALGFALCGSAQGGVQFKGEGYLQNLLFYATDNDFDSSTPYYKPSGQYVGYIATHFNPKFSIIADELTIYYEAELGMNLWSRNTPEEFSFNASALLYKHRQIYAMVKEEKWELRVGYQYVQDPSGLFINHWLGALYGSVRAGGTALHAFLGQLPDQTYEGWTLSENNFRHDTFAGGAWADFSHGKVSLACGLMGLYSTEVILKSAWLLAPVVSARYRTSRLTAGVDLMIQGGLTNRGTIDLNDEKHISGALQVYIWWGAARTAWGEYRDGRVVPGLSSSSREERYGWGASLLILSPDNSKERDSWNFAFLYSGRSRSRTLFLTEDELRDRGDNLDERISQKMGLFFRTRPGYVLSDISGYYYITEELLLMGITGAAFALQSGNALGNYFIAGEIDLALRWQITPHLVFDLVNSAILPGKAGSAFVNAIDVNSTKPVYSAEISINAFF